MAPHPSSLHLGVKSHSKTYWGGFVYTPHHLFTYQVVYISRTHGYLYFELPTTFFILVLRLFQPGPLGALSVGSCVLLTCPHYDELFFSKLSYFVVPHNAPGQPCTFPAPTLESALSPRRVVVFFGKWLLDTKIWVCLPPLGCHCCLHLRGESSGAHLRTLTRAHARAPSPLRDSARVRVRTRFPGSKPRAAPAALIYFCVSTPSEAAADLTGFQCENNI